MSKIRFLAINFVAMAALRLAVYRLLINWHFSIPILFALISSFANFILLWMIGKKLFSNKVAYWTCLIYGISPWVVYLEMSGSVYLFYLTAILVVLYLYLRYSLPKIIVLLFLAIIIFINIPKITLFSDIDVMNNLNTFQGAAKKSQLSLVARFIENKYTYFGQRYSLSFLNYLTPTTYFTSNTKLLGWSFSPPILIGFLIPFLIGIPLYFSRWVKNKFILSLPFLFLFPATLSVTTDLNRLILFSPIIFYNSAIGIGWLIESKKTLFRIITFVIFGLIIWQYLMVISDILYSEPVRFLQWQQLHA